MKKNMMKLVLTAALFTALACGAFAGGQGGRTDAGGRQLYRIDVYTQLANYAGMQVGWFAKLIKDKFNIELNIIPDRKSVV